MSLKAAVGDLIQYRFQPPKDVPHTTVRRVTAVVESEAKGRLGYTVEGGFFVPNKDVFTVIPMHEEQRAFPLEGKVNDHIRFDSRPIRFGSIRFRGQAALAQSTSGDNGNQQPRA